VVSRLAVCLNYANLGSPLLDGWFPDDLDFSIERGTVVVLAISFGGVEDIASSGGKAPLLSNSRIIVSSDVHGFEGRLLFPPKRNRI